MSKGVLSVPAKVIATCVALVSFAGAIVVGLAAGNSAAVILMRALLVMLVAWVVGRIIGGIAQQHVQATITAYKDAHPIPREVSEVEVELLDGDDEEVIDAIPLEEAAALASAQSPAGKQAAQPVRARQSA